MIARHLKELLERLHPFADKMAFISGPRQVGKTTLSRQLLGTRDSKDLYRNWDDLEWRKEFVRKPYGFLDAFRPQGKHKPLVVFDEIHKYPLWKRYLKGLYDTHRERVDILVTGSGSLAYYQKGGDSLLGRYLPYRMHPLSLRELAGPSAVTEKYSPDMTVKGMAEKDSSSEHEQKLFDALYKWGGFPESFVRRNSRLGGLLRKERKRLLIREDLRDFARVQAVSGLELLVEMLDERIGSLLSLNPLAQDIGVSQHTISLWINYFERLHYLYIVRPWTHNLARAIRKESKPFLWDWSAVEDAGHRLENLVASHLLKWCHFTQDFGFDELDLHFVRDKEKREVDFLVSRKGKPWMLIEVKKSDTTPPAAIHYFADKLKVSNLFLVTGDRIHKNGNAGRIRVMDAASFLSQLPV